MIILDYFLNEERTSIPALMLSLHMQVVTKGNQFTFDQCEKWMSDAGFGDFTRANLTWSINILIGKKQV